MSGPNQQKLISNDLSCSPRHYTFAGHKKQQRALRTDVVNQITEVSRSDLFGIVWSYGDESHQNIIKYRIF